jgi:MFS family permease
LSNPWPSARLPRGHAAVLAALHLADPRGEGLGRLTEQEWRTALDFTNRSMLTLILRRQFRDAMPPWAREQTDRDAGHNRQRLTCIQEMYRSIGEWLGARGVEFAALKGVTQCPHFGAHLEDRVQYDIDLFTPGEQVAAARDAFYSAGFESLDAMEGSPTDHIPALFRKTGWEWQGDFFDPEMPLAVEIHFRFWNGAMERLPAVGIEEFWNRRTVAEVLGLNLPVLRLPDALGYASLHLLKHILQGSGRPFHAYEVAWFLDSHAGDDQFWREWRALHPPELRRLEAVSFRLAQEWFGCKLSPAAQEEAERLPAATQAWFEEFATSPAGRLFHSRKDELWLHLSLLESRRDALSVVRRRLLPLRLPGPVDAIYIPESEMNWHRRALKGLRWAAYSAKRLRHHAASLPYTARSGVRWWWRTNNLGTQFWIFLVAAVLFNIGVFIFVMLYNLHLKDLGHREDFLGTVTGAERLGTFAGVIPAAFLARRLGLRNAFVSTLAAATVIITCRVLITAETPLVALAFVWGLSFSVWAVVMAPMVSGVVEERRQPRAFSVFFAVMFMVGVVASWTGGHLASWKGKPAALVIAAALVAVSLLPALRLAPTRPTPEGTRIYPRSPFLVRYLVPFALWHLATGAFNPFFNTYFYRLRIPVARIGTIVAGSQSAQVIAVLLSPLVLRKAGLVQGIVWMMAATALGLGGLATQPAGVGGAALAYTAYMCVQWMSEPGLNTLLMNQVPERERSGASALNYLVVFGAQAVAAFGSGALLARYGYGAVLAGAAVLGAAAAGLFWILVAPAVARRAMDCGLAEPVLVGHASGPARQEPAGGPGSLSH